MGLPETFIDHYCTTRLVKYDNQKYVDRGRSLIITYSSNWDKELKKANHHKNGAPFQVLSRIRGLARVLTGMLSQPVSDNDFVKDMVDRGLIML